MKKIIMICLVLLLSSPSLVLASWEDDFRKDSEKYGLDQAVENALADDRTTEQILELMLSNEEITQRTACKALYCAGVEMESVQKAAHELNVSEEDIAKALEESIAECGTKLEIDDRDNPAILASPSTP